MLHGDHDGVVTVGNRGAGQAVALCAQHDGKARLGAQPEAKRGALGTIETFTVASVILAADCAVKSADVEILELRTARGMGGKGVVLLTGDVADVTAAVEAGARYAKEQGVFVGQSILGAPHEELWNFL